MSKKMKIFDVKVGKEDGVTAVALVDEPAIESNFVAFADEKTEGLKLAKDEYKQIVTGPVLIPDKLIMRIDKVSKEPYYLRFSKDVIEELALRFHEKKLTDETNEDHDDGKAHKDIFMFESVLIKNEEMAAGFEKLGLDKLPEGSWVASFKIKDKDVFNRVLSGELRGFSIEAYLDRVFVGEEEMKKAEEEKAKAEAEAKARKEMAKREIETRKIEMEML